MPKFARVLWGRKEIKPSRSFYIERPLVLLQSDDWGRVGVRDEEGYELLRAAGIRLGEHPYDLYSLETAHDVSAVREVLRKHKDSTGRSACMGMNFVMKNLDFGAMSKDSRKISFLPLTHGLPGKWERSGLFEAYQSGIVDGTFSPSLHGTTHFCQMAVENALTKDNQRSQLLRKFWSAETPYIYWRMPWIGYEYHNPEKPHAGFLPAGVQDGMINEAAKIFKELFSRQASSACAPGYRANSDTHDAWARHGIRVAQNGSRSPLHPYIDEFEILNLYRTIDFEPSQKDLPVEKYIHLAETCFARGVPAIISVHSINFHSTLKDFRTPTLRALDEFLSALERKFPNLLYVHDMDVHDIVTRGKFRAPHGMVSVSVRLRDAATRS